MQAAQNALAGHMQPAGRVLETPALSYAAKFYLLAMYGDQNNAEN